MRKPGFILACLVCTVYARRVRESIPEHEEMVAESHEPFRALTSLLLASKPEVGFQPSGPGQRMPMDRKSSSSSRPAKQVEKLASRLSAGALAAGALISFADFAAAEDPISQFAKVDKTGPIGFLASLVESGIDLAHNGLVGAGVENAYGISIILFTLFIRACTFPLIVTQQTTSAKMQQLQPLQKKISNAFPKPEEASQYSMQLMQAANANPIAGCLPALAQIPVFLSLYRALTNLEAEQKLNEPFLWIPNLEGPVYGAPPDKTLEWVQSIFSGDPKLGWPDTLAFLSLPLIFLISQTISSRVIAPPKDPKTMTKQEADTQTITQFLPYVVAFFSLNVPAGLALYWTISNVLTTTINLLVKNTIKADSLSPEVDRIMKEIDLSVDRREKRMGQKVAEEFSVGSVGRVISPAELRTGISLESDLICEMPVGSRIVIQQLDQRRARITTTDGVMGWLSILNAIGEPLVALMENPDRVPSVDLVDEGDMIVTIRKKSDKGSKS